jgi:Lon protease-like protein
VRRVRALLSELGNHPPLPADALDGSGPLEQVWRLCAATPLNTFDRQRLLEAGDPTARLALLSELSDELADDMTRLLAARPEPDE